MTFTIESTETPIVPLLSKKTRFLYLSKKIVALALILTPLYHIYDAARDMLIVFPQISFVGNPTHAQTLYVSLIKKAIVISFSLFFDSFYGFVLLVKPKAATKFIHIIFGVFIFILSQIVFRLAAIDQILSQIQFFPLI